MSKFAIHLPVETTLTSKPPGDITFVGNSYPHYSRILECVEHAISAQDYLRVATRQADYHDFSSVHKKSYLDQLQAMAGDEEPESYPRLSRECTGLEYCIPGYLYTLGGMQAAIDQMKAGSLERAWCYNMGGHHAYPDWGHGYCILNSPAAAVRYAQRQGFERVLIVDWDIHHGDGTQAIFAHDADVYHISLHSALDFYMVLQRVIRDGTTTRAVEVGHCNIPILEQHYDDDDWHKMGMTGTFYRTNEVFAAFAEALEQVPWSPDLVLIFAGCDSHQDDCGGDITNWAFDDFRSLTRRVLDLTHQAHCPVLSVQGGGYNLPVTVATSQVHIETLATYF